jgi:hypothetical protein
VITMTTSETSPKGGVVYCACGTAHRLSPTALAVALQAFIDGDGQRVGTDAAITPMCIFELLENAPESAIRGRRLRRMDYAFYAFPQAQPLPTQEGIPT